MPPTDTLGNPPYASRQAAKIIVPRSPVQPRGSRNAVHDSGSPWNPGQTVAGSSPAGPCELCLMASDAETLSFLFIRDLHLASLRLQVEILPQKYLPSEKTGIANVDHYDA